MMLPIAMTRVVNQEKPNPFAALFDHKTDMPMPRKQSGSTSQLIEFAKTMKVGDSVAIHKNINSATGVLFKGTGFKFSRRVMPDRTFRVWRIE